MIEIDGSQGEGGGQVLRTALSLSACLGKPVHIRHIRQGRAKPGLMRQHLACVKAIAEVSNAHVRGAFIGSRAVEFVPDQIKGGEYHFSVGSAGSSTLVFQTVLPALMLAKEPSLLTLEGGTHNPLAPSFDFVRHAFLPLLEQMGFGLDAKLERYGFYPVGAGKWTVSIYPPDYFRFFELHQRGQLLDCSGECLGAKIPSHIVAREKKQLLRKLNWPEDAIIAKNVESLGSGNIVSLFVRYPKITEVIDSIGSIGVSSEQVANKAVEALHRYQSVGAPVGRYLADQLLLPLVVTAGGKYVTGPLSEHSKTNISVMRQLADVKIKTEEIMSKKQWMVSVGG